MKTLILNGSPRKNGDTAQLLELAKAQLQGTYHVVSAYTANIHPCIDCRHCLCRRDGNSLYVLKRLRPHFTCLSDLFFRTDRIAAKCRKPLTALFLRTIFQKRTNSAAYPKGSYGIGWRWDGFS